MGARLVNEFFRLHQLGEAEVEDLNASILGDEQIVGLQIAVDDAFFVRGGKAASDLHAIVNSFAEGQGTAADRLGQGLTFQQFGYRDRERRRKFPSGRRREYWDDSTKRRPGLPVSKRSRRSESTRNESGKNFDRDVAV